MRYLIPFLLLFTACSSGPMITAQSVPTPTRTDTLEASYDRAFTAVLDAYSAKGFGVDEVNKEVGLAKSGFKQSGNIVGSKARSQFSARISRLDSTRTKVQLTATAQRETMGGWNAASMTEERARKLYANAFSTIKDQL
ncbi:hypothetical protein [Salinibacter ruber]|jgi:hypothetical protein|uniref:Lipoprotein n=1 Tax=Salinibacter ruber TaxID=146919 RepID=A0AAW5PD24_9BACT|nr:hypothetical protein [Salinibacter ruber]MBB4062783.1 hypothetical protein [Salinibacter ruber]MCS4159490.1 hypothetical protein [Salinibacter ruber]